MPINKWFCHGLAGVDAVVMAIRAKLVTSDKRNTDCVVCNCQIGAVRGQHNGFRSMPKGKVGLANTHLCACDPDYRSKKLRCSEKGHGCVLAAECNQRF